jgi:hypothetical protein
MGNGCGGGGSVGATGANGASVGKVPPGIKRDKAGPKRSNGVPAAFVGTPGMLDITASSRSNVDKGGEAPGTGGIGPSDADPETLGAPNAAAPPVPPAALPADTLGTPNACAEPPKLGAGVTPKPEIAGNGGNVCGGNVGNPPGGNVCGGNVGNPPGGNVCGGSVGNPPGGNVCGGNVGNPPGGNVCGGSVTAPGGKVNGGIV